MNINGDVEQLVNKFKKGIIPYKSLTLEQIDMIKLALQKEIKEDEEAIEDVKKKITQEKKKIENM